MTDTIVQHTLDTVELPIDRVHPNPDNVRSDLGDLEPLADSIRSLGVHTPCLVYPQPDGDGHVLIYGHRRRGAAELAGLETIPCVIRTEPDQVTLLELMLSENNQREPLDPIDEAKALTRIKAEGGYRNVAQIARAVSRSKEWVAGRLQLLGGLPEDLWPAVSSHKVTLAEAEAVARLKVPPAEKRRIFGLDSDARDRAIADETSRLRRAQARKKIEEEYGELLPPSDIHRLRSEHPWGIALIGSGGWAELNVPVAMHRAACEGHVAVESFSGVPQAYCTAPLAHLHADEFSEKGMRIPDGVVPLSTLDLSWAADQAHARHCPHHQPIALPWGEIVVCMAPADHDNDGPLNEGRLEQLHEDDQAGRKPGEPLQDAPRWVFPPDAEQLLEQRIREQIADLPDWVLAATTIDWGPGSLGDDESVADLIVRAAVADVATDVRSADRNPTGLLGADVPFLPALIAGLDACVDVGAPPPNIDEIRTRIDVITKGEVASDA